MLASDGDACMHWRVGQWMIENRQIIRSDHFSHTRIGMPIISKEWLSELIFAWAGNSKGLYGLSVIGALVIAASFGLLHNQLLRRGNDVLVATSITLLAALAACAHWLARPHVFSLLMATFWSGALQKFNQTKNSKQLAISLSLLTLLWVNLHGAFLIGFQLLGCYWLGALLQKDISKVKILTVTGILCGITSLANPNGYGLHFHNLKFLSSDFFRGWLAEYASIQFHSPDALGFAAYLALIYLTLAIRRPRLTTTDAVILISWVYFALYSARNIPLLAIFSAPILAPALTGAVPKHWRLNSERISIYDKKNFGWISVLIIVFILFALPRTTEMPSKDWPVDAVKFIENNPEHFQGNMFNQYGWGGYLMEFLPTHKVFVDGRADFYGEALVKEFDLVTALKPGWEEPLMKYNVAWTLMPTDHRLNVALGLLPEWELTFSNSVSTIYSKTR